MIFRARSIFCISLLSATAVYAFTLSYAEAACYQTQTFPPQTICTADTTTSGDSNGGVAGGSGTATGGTTGAITGGGTGTVGSAGSPPQTVSSGPVANWKFEESGGATVIDSSGYGNNGVLENGATRFVGTQGGNKLMLDGVDDRVIVSPVSGSASNMNSFTLMAWIRPSRTGGTIMRKGNTDVARFNFGINPQGMLYFRAGYTGTTGAWVSTQPVPVESWSHVAVTYTSGASAPVIYISGVSVALTQLTAPAGEMVADTPYLFIGNTHNFINTAQAGGSSFFSGRMDDVRIYNFALSSDAVASAKTPEPDASAFIPIPMPWNPIPLPVPTTPQGIVTYTPPSPPGNAVIPSDPPRVEPPIQGPIVAPSCPTLTRNLSRGARGTDVAEMQRFLISRDHLSAGNDSGYFGVLTQAAVQKFQCTSMGICSGSPESNGYGAVGPRTRAAMAQACGERGLPLVPGTQPGEPSKTTTGWVEKITAGDGVIRGWAADKNSPSSQISVNVYVDATQNSKGALIGTARAGAINKAVEWEAGIAGNHGFAFQIPSSYFDNKSHTYSVEPIDAQGRMGPVLGGALSSVTLAPSSAAPRSSVTDANCLSPGSRCASYGNDYLSPNFPMPTGETDGVNYFSEWQCSSPTGINTITKLNIIPYGMHGTTFQKDSLFVDSSGDGSSSFSSPTMYFTSSSYASNSTFSLKKAVFTADRWNIYSVLDNPLSSGGVSSQDGRGLSIIMNDYSLPGWGPSSPIAGSQSLVPGVSDTSAGTQIPSYPLVGTGPLGITALMNTVHPSSVSGGVEGRTCIHMNPKLFDYDASGRPQSMLVNLWQNTITEACPLPPGAPMAKLPAPGTYVYRYQGSTLGWQLDLSAGLIKDSVTNDGTNRLALVYKPINGSRSSLAATWDGEVVKLDMNAPAISNATKLLDCNAPGVHLGEATGSAENFYFLASPPGQPLYLSQSPEVFYADIYYASSK